MAAGEYFFHSFTGSVVYGHGTPRNISKVLRLVVMILSDALFMVVVVHLLQMLVCDYPSGGGEAFVVAAPKYACWKGDHAAMSIVALVAYSVYAPLSIMLGACAG